MSYDTKLADRVREYLNEVADIQIEEKKMFSGLAFLVNEKMCVNVSGENLMCRFDHHRYIWEQWIRPCMLRVRARRPPTPKYRHRHHWH